MCDGDSPLPQFEAERVAERLHAELRCAVGPVEREHEQAADRPDVDDAAVAPSDQRQERLGHRDGADQVDLELAAEVVERLELDRRRV